MEKPWKIKARILAFLPKAATPVTFIVSPPLSPVKTGTRKIPMIPKEARRKPKNSSFEQKEPASPKVSCMGQVKKRNSRRKPKLVVVKPPAAPAAAIKIEEKEKKKKKVPLMKIFKGHNKKVDAAVVHNINVPGGVVQRVPSLGQIKKYASGHGAALENFDWRICEEEEEEERGGGKVIIPSHVGAVEPKKEVNLWKRRNKNPPIPLEI